MTSLYLDGLACSRCGSTRHVVHRRHREPVLDYRSRYCRSVFNAYTGTMLQGISRRPSALVLILRRVAQGISTARLARELSCDRMKLVALRHKLQDHARAGLAGDPLADAVVEADECYINAGEKRSAASPAG